MRIINGLAVLATIGLAVPAQAQCPKDLNAANAYVRQLPNKGAVDQSGCVWACSDKYDYDTSGVTVLGATPLSAQTTIINDKISQLLFRLPGMPGNYLAPFQKAFAKAECSDSDYDDYDSCEWEHPGDTVPLGQLEEVKMNLTIMEKNVTYLYCDYQIFDD